MNISEINISENSLHEKLEIQAMLIDSITKTLTFELKEIDELLKPHLLKIILDVNKDCVNHFLNNIANQYLTCDTLISSVKDWDENIALKTYQSLDLMNWAYLNCKDELKYRCVSSSKVDLSNMISDKIKFLHGIEIYLQSQFNIIISIITGDLKNAMVVRQTKANSELRTKRYIELED